MAEHWTDKSRYKSNFGGEREIYISASQYITECLCVLIARQDKITLVPQFWKHPPWEKLFREQIPAAASLLKEYPPEVILAALRDRRCWKIRSLRARYLLVPILKEKLAKHEVQMQKLEENASEKVSTTEKPRRPIGDRKSVIAKLKELDG